MVHSRKASSDEAWCWTSGGDGEFTLESSDKETSGTEITLFLRDSDEDDALDDFTAEWTLRQTIKRYSDFVQCPIELEVKKSTPIVAEEGEEDEEVKNKSELSFGNGNKLHESNLEALSDEVSDEEYNEFYKHISKAWDEPADRFRFRS